ncbi:hypothetical protein [Paenibacillus puerhi]|uniref:hypothetical protein n=1 Tax=Paenibacillus puerhi TaxID=2692622 RepID=UPI00135C5196|nr:hypothetical protein [Paenibacillus puerhi]
MKRYLTWLIIAVMAFSLIACSSGAGQEAAPGTPAPSEQAVALQPEPAKPAGTTPPADASKPETTAPPATDTKPEGAVQPDAKPADTQPPADGKAAQPSTVQPEAKPAAGSDSKPEPKPEPKPEAKPEAKPAPATPPAQPEAAPQAEEVSAKGKKLLFVGRERSPAEDVAVAKRLQALGFQITNLEDRDVNADEVKGFDLIYYSQTTNSKYLKDGFMKDIAIPTVYVKNHGMYYLGLSAIEENATEKNVKTIEITDSKHKVAGGLSGKIDVFKEAGDKFGVSYGLPGKEAKVIATIPGDKKKAALYYYDKGTKADNGYEVKARTSFYFWSNGMHENSTDAGWELLDRIVLWTLQNG